MWGFPLLHIFANILCCQSLSFFIFLLAIPECVKWYFIIVLVWISMVINNVENLFMWLLTLYLSTFVKFLFKSFAHFFFFFVCFVFLFVFCQFYKHCEYFFPICNFTVCFLNGVFWWVEYFNVVEVSFIFLFLLWSMLSISCLRNCCLFPDHENILLCTPFF